MIMVDGAVSDCTVGNSGLLAGCLELGSMVEFQVRDYVDDIVVVHEAEHARMCASGLKEQVEQVKIWLRANAVVLNEDKEQAWATSATMERELKNVGFE